MTIAELEECINLYGKDIYGFCRRMTGSVQEGEDLYQDTFLKAMELSAHMDERGNPKSYLLSISIRLWKNKRRKYAWRQRIAGMESLDEKLESKVYENQQAGEIPEEKVLENERREFVYRCVQELQDKYRIPICLYYSAFLSVKEISECMKLPEGTVKSRLYKGRTLIKEKLEVAGYDR